MENKWKAKFEEMDSSIAELTKKAESLKEDAKAARDLGKEVIDDKIGTMKGNVEALKENIRITDEQNKSKLSSTLLKAQMTIEAKIQDMREAKDKKDLEKYIEHRVDYIDDCFITAAYLIENAELAMLEALAAAVEYDERFAREASE